MPLGDAAKIHRYLGELVIAARGAGSRRISFRAGDVRDALELNHAAALLDVCQVLDTQKFQDEVGVTFLNKTGPGCGVSSTYRFSI